MLKRMQGVGLIEVLVAIALAAIGLVALAAMQATSLRQAKQTQLRAVAALLANDISERMRANLHGATGGSYAVTADFASQGQLPAQPAQMCDAPGVICTPDQLAAADLFAWRQLVRDQLPTGAAYLQSDAAAVGAWDLWLAWREPGSPDAAVLTGGSKECPPGLGVGQDATIRCLYFRVQL